MRKTAKIPTFVGLFLLLIGVAAGVLLIQRESIFNLSASPSSTPTDVRITNITDKGFSVSWVTAKPEAGFISYGKSKSVGTVVNQGSLQNSYVHHVNIDNLEASSQYYFKIGSGNSGISKDGKLYSLKTGTVLKNSPDPDIVFGSVANSQNNPVAGTVVYLTIAGVYPLSAVTDEKGKWAINLGLARQTSLATQGTYDKQETIIELFVQAGNNQFSSAKIKAGAAHPVPQMVLGKVHDFTNLKPVSDGKVPQSEFDLSLQFVTPSPSPVSGFGSQARTSPSPSPKAKTSPSPSPKTSPKPSPSPAFGASASQLGASPSPLGASPSPVAVGGTSATPVAAPFPTPSPTPKQTVATVSATTKTSESLPSAGNLTVTLYVFIMGLVLVIVGMFVPQSA